MSRKTVSAQPVTQMFGHLGRPRWVGQRQKLTKLFMGKTVNYKLKKIDSMTSMKNYESNMNKGTLQFIENYLLDVYFCSQHSAAHQRTDTRKNLCRHLRTHHPR